LKATGVVRRIDDLGRVVIPKEVRRTLRIREGDPLEIFVDRDGEVILKKYAPVTSLEDNAKDYAASLFENLGQPVAIADGREIIAVAGLPKKEKGKDLNPVIEEASARGAPIVLTDVQLLSEGGTVFAQVAAAPVMKGEIQVGTIVVAAKDNLKDEALKAIEVAGRFLGKRMLR